MKTLLTSAAVIAASASSAFATVGGFSTPVPEISALEGTAAIAAVAAIVLLAWERRSRA